MKEEKAINRKIEEIEEVLSRRRTPSPERVDIIGGLRDVMKHGKYGTLHLWEEKKNLLKKLDEEKKSGRPKNWYQDYWGRKVMGNDMDGLTWQMAAYAWALEIQDPALLSMVAYIQAVQKLKKKQEYRR